MCDLGDLPEPKKWKKWGTDSRVLKILDIGRHCHIIETMIILKKPLLILALAGFAAVFVGGCCQCLKGDAMNEPMLAHNVYFTLNENTAQQRQHLTEDCYAYLKDHPGVVFFAAGIRAEAYNRPVNVVDFDVSLHVVFDSQKAHDDYQISPKHLEFVQRNKDNWKQVRVLDSLVY